MDGWIFLCSFFIPAENPAPWGHICTFVVLEKVIIIIVIVIIIVETETGFFCTLISETVGMQSKEL